MDFARDFRGDTIHPSVMEILEQLGLAEGVLQLEHTTAPTLPLQTSSEVIDFANFTRLKTRYPYILLIPQARFLEFITREAQRYPNFRLLMGARAEQLVEEDGYVHGVQYRRHDGWHEVRATLTVGADGRFSRIRALAGFATVKSSPPIDVLWFRLPRQVGDSVESGARLTPGHFMVLLNRGNEWQIAYTIAKGGYQQIKAAGLEQFRSTVGKLVPDFAERMQTITAWKQIAVLSVESSRVRRWYRPGLLLIGDAAHVMTPVGGVGINYAIQDAVAAANILTADLQQGKVDTRDLARVQRRREWPTRFIQAFQRLAQHQFLGLVRSSDEVLTVPPIVRLILRTPILRDIPARFMAFGPGRERVQNP
ncbi:MAG: FAD-dependent oxidoreductase [Ktedonobacteraceae bacterium]